MGATSPSLIWGWGVPFALIKAMTYLAGWWGGLWVTPLGMISAIALSTIIWHKWSGNLLLRLSDDSCGCAPVFLSGGTGAGDSALPQQKSLDGLQRTLYTDWIMNLIWWCLACQRFYGPFPASIWPMHLAATSPQSYGMQLLQCLPNLQLAPIYLYSGRNCRKHQKWNPNPQCPWNLKNV